MQLKFPINNLKQEYSFEEKNYIYHKFDIKI